MLPAITFSFNISPSDSTKYSPYEVVYGFRPKFPLSVSKLGIDLNSLHSDYHSYMNQQIDKLKLIREEAVVNAQKASEIMKERENKKTNPLKLNIGDFVYMLKEVVGPGKKLQPKYSGPYVVHEILSPHIVKLREKDSGKLFKNPVHLDRLKIAFVRAPNPTNYFIPISVKNEQTLNEIEKRAITNSEPTSNVVSDEPNSEPSVNNNLRTRPVRQIRKPMRYRSELGNISESTVADTSSSEQTDNTFYKVKRILAQRKRNECYEYLVQYKR
ncbi:unnamed protein product [Mytilus coruscus]|uniref:Integrase zinc-binding domain-containing protein n=1 Tax=Mytilus coruscus TaxID=42192 RepID=A0A6J8D0K1_MYTCO|nr:unnamed protein product [Mytilus coruscus]